MNASRSLLRHFETWSSRHFDEDALRHALATGGVNHGDRDTIAAIMHEASPEILIDLIVEGAATMQSLDRLTSVIFANDHPVRKFVHERAA